MSLEAYLLVVCLCFVLITLYCLGGVCWCLLVSYWVCGGFCFLCNFGWFYLLPVLVYCLVYLLFGLPLLLVLLYGITEFGFVCLYTCLLGLSLYYLMTLSDYLLLCISQDFLGCGFRVCTFVFALVLLVGFGFYLLFGLYCWFAFVIYFECLV